MNPDGSISCLTKSSESQPCYRKKTIFEFLRILSLSKTGDNPYFIYFNSIITLKPCTEDVYDYWAPWEVCSVSCGGEGTRKRVRHCATRAFTYLDEFPLAKPCFDNPGTAVSFSTEIKWLLSA